MSIDIVVSLAGGLDDVLARAATFNPTSIAFLNQSLLFTDTSADRIRWIPNYLTLGTATTVYTLVGSARGDVPGKVDQLLNQPTQLIRDDVASNNLRTRFWFVEQGLAAGNQLKILDIDYANGT
jgi:hypothetical protein